MTNNGVDPLDGWVEPDDDLIDRALSRIGDWQHRRVFFEGLDNPRWVSALEARHCFGPPNGPSADSDGREWWQRWPEGGYLVRMASLVPDEVARIMARVADSQNPYVHELVLQAALNLPAELAKNLVRPVEGYLRRGTIYNAEEVVELAEQLAAAGLRQPAVRILQAAFRPRSAADAGPISSSRRVSVGINPSWYEELLPRAVTALDAALGEEVLRSLLGWLDAFQRASGGFDPASGSDTSFIWRPSIADHPQNKGNAEVGDSLVEAVRERALADLQGGRSAAEVLAILERNAQHLPTRIGLHVLALDAEGRNDALQAGYERLVDPRLLELEYRHEYTELARNLLPLLSTEQTEVWESVILSGPYRTRKELLDRLERFADSDQNVDEAIDRYREQWQLNMLSAIGIDTLPRKSRSRFTELAERHGVPEHPEFPFYMEFGFRSDTPMSADELRAMTLDQIRDFLETWTPSSGLERFEASKIGLSRAFSAVVAERPMEFSVAAADFMGLDPTYFRALLDGLKQAVTGGTQIDWAPVLAASAAVASIADDGSEVDDRLEEDVVWRYAQRAIAELVELGSVSEEDNGIPKPLLAAALAAVAPLVDHPDPTPAYEDKFGGQNMDPLTLSLNTTRPAAIRAVVDVARKAKLLADQNALSERSDDVILKALDLLSGRLRPARDESLSVAAVFGEQLRLLVWIDPDWLAAHVSSLLTEDSYGEVVLSTVLATSSPSRQLLDVIDVGARALIDSAGEGELAEAGWRTDRSPVEMLGDHLVLLRVQGAIPADHPLLTRFFEVAPVGVRARVLGHLGWQLMRSGDVPEAALERAVALWDSRAGAVERKESTVDELAEFYWWARADKFPRAWWLPRLQQAARSAAFEARGMLGEALEGAASEYPGRVVAVVESLLASSDEPLARHDLVRHAPGIIAAALDSGDPDALAAAERVMDSLGRLGHIQIAELVRARRSPQLGNNSGQ